MVSSLVDYRAPTLLLGMKTDRVLSLSCLTSHTEPNIHAPVVLYLYIHRGRVYKVGGLDEKMRVAKAMRLGTFVYPSDNRFDIVPSPLRGIPVANIFDLLRATVECEWLGIAWAMMMMMIIMTV